MTVTHNGKSYTVTKLASGHEWRLNSVDSPRDSITLNRDQMILAGFGHVLEAGHDQPRTNS